MTQPERNYAPLELLLVEDNPGDVRLTREALKDNELATHLSVVVDGEAAVEFVHRRGEYADAPRPVLILLDLNLPKKDGREVLAEIKADPDLRRIPVIVLTSSKSESDVIAAYELHANSYCAKPVQLDAFIELVGSIEAFWLNRATLPPR